jgi:hypothetical protein
VETSFLHLANQCACCLTSHLHRVGCFCFEIGFDGLKALFVSDGRFAVPWWSGFLMKHPDASHMFCPQPWELLTETTYFLEAGIAARYPAFHDRHIWTRQGLQYGGSSKTGDASRTGQYNTSAIFCEIVWDPKLACPSRLNIASVAVHEPLRSLTRPDDSLRGLDELMRTSVTAVQPCVLTSRL